MLVDELGLLKYLCCIVYCHTLRTVANNYFATYVIKTVSTSDDAQRKEPVSYLK